MMKRLKIITELPKLMENSNIGYYRHPSAIHKSCKVIRQAKKVGSDKNSPILWYNETTKHENSFNEKNTKITKRSHAYKGYASTYNVELLNSFNPNLQFKNPEFAIRNKLKDLLTEFRGSKFVTTLVNYKKLKLVKN